MSMWRSKVRAPLAYAIMMDDDQSWYSWVENPMVTSGYRRLRKSIWLSSRSESSLGYSDTQWLIANGMWRFSKKVTIASMLRIDAPPVETMTGFRVFAIFSSNDQSVMSELAILMISMPRSSQRSTDASS